ncbi:MAG TPA: acylphosphatase [Candidatus Paceibacterota bacterium]|nr:acylphosphatase [Candidatus Paceibacterota bacterium]
MKIHGYVQGVFFRESARAEALRLGIFGFARNEPDGGVYIEAEGNDENLKKFIDWCRHGPEMAKVTKVDVEYSDELKFYNDFKIM